MSLAIAYQMKRKAQKMAQGGYAEKECTDCAAGQCHKHSQTMMSGGMVDDGDQDDIVDRVMKRRMAQGGMVQKDEDELADFAPNEFDDLELMDEPKSSYTGANSGDELGNPQEDEDERDIVAKIMKSRRIGGKMPRPA